MTEDGWELFSSLAEPQRRDLYRYVRARHRPVTREEAAAACDVSRSLAAFHLDKLVEAGLLTATTRVDDTAAPRGRGRPPKAYELSDTEIRLVLPERRLDLLGDILLDAVAATPGDALQAALDAGRDRGEQLGRRHRPRRRGNRRGLTTVATTLAELGAEPRRDGDNRLVLANCPFRPLAQRRPELVCQMYRALCEGVIAGVGATARATADPSPGRCCVAIQAHG